MLNVPNWKKKQIILIHILPNISKRESIMTFGQLKEYNMGNIFLQKSCKKWSREKYLKNQERVIKSLNQIKTTFLEGESSTLIYFVGISGSCKPTFSRDSSYLLVTTLEIFISKIYWIGLIYISTMLLHNLYSHTKSWLITKE